MQYRFASADSIDLQYLVLSYHQVCPAHMCKHFFQSARLPDDGGIRTHMSAPMLRTQKKGAPKCPQWDCKLSVSYSFACFIQ